MGTVLAPFAALTLKHHHHLLGVLSIYTCSGDNNRVWYILSVVGNNSEKKELDSFCGVLNSLGTGQQERLPCNKDA